VEHWDLLGLEAPDGTRDPTVLLSDDGSRAVLVALGRGQELGDHQVKENAWVTVVQGTVRVTAGGETVEGGVGSTFHFAPDERHSLATDEGARVLLLLAPWPGEGHYRGNR
jgi:quercetin dioxygenase-like cupin family protein